jgi:hypothetical protein
MKSNENSRARGDAPRHLTPLQSVKAQQPNAFAAVRDCIMEYHGVQFGEQKEIHRFVIEASG